MRPWLPGLAASVLVLTATCAVHAQGAGSAEAEELFQQGRVALGAHDYPLACAKFGTSLQLETAVGTLMSLAECEEARGQLASARQHWQEAADLADARNDPLWRGPYGRRRFAAVDARAPRLRVRLADGAPRDTVLRRDDVALGTAGFDVELPVDPGSHVLTLSAFGHETSRYPITLDEGEHRVIEVEPGRALAEPAAAPSALAWAPSTPTKPTAPTVPPSAPSGSGPRRTAAYVLGGVGLVGIGIGAYFGINAFLEWGKASQLCPCEGNQRETATLHQTTAQTDGTVSTVAFAAGGAAVAAGVVLWLTARSAPTAEKTSRLIFTPAIDPHGAAFAVQGPW